MNQQWLIAGFAMAAGLSFALIAWVVSRLAAEVPEQDRIWLDPPPLGYRLLWWPVQWLAHYIGPLLSMAWQNALLLRLRVGGVDYALNPAQFVAGRLIWGLVFGGVGVWLAQSFKLDAWMPFFGGFLLGFIYPVVWLKDRIDVRRRETLKSLPFMLDLITLCVESGLNLSGAIQQAVDKGPSGALKDEFARLLRDVRAGRPRSEALRELAQRMDLPAVSSFVSTLIQAEVTGMALGPILRAQAEQRRVERFARAEKLAMEAPVKLLFPLIFFIFPCVFAILMFPIVMKFMEAGT
ncbi:type II secretion system F family protein [Rhodoferax ferrireducens]|uniref:type II secretion system F family protein n=1 Tax=Rhodoferax ferrireducens TaxID=192843 RepID=UPI000E0DCEA3|nr:type II secretion system F family protein [Rhodoferax ferrireducens]